METQSPQALVEARYPILAAFHTWMREHRGLAESTLANCRRILVHLLDVIGDDPHAYTVEALRAFVLRRAQPYGIEYAKSVVTAVRAFLRFLGTTGRCPPGMEYGVPGFLVAQLDSMPRYIGQEEVQRVIEACIVDTPLGTRDRAIVLLLSRLGLRAGEVARLSIKDIDWQNGRVAVQGKSRRREWLPLSQEVGDAILDYLRQRRSTAKVPEVFVGTVAPFRPLQPQSIATIVRKALIRAGVVAPTMGAHVLRHSAATAMLRQGVSLAGVGAVLRHRSFQTTAHYAKVDFRLLAEIAQPWPGTQSC